eukprot:CAMPEP_0172492024 /NCGR_PEP_ID=MMETSP1066-20121228/22997_1 /TAXON_ID=671091 /ORGANISM="Coscinodiscus wailesii, Strain CCMP2513" /LENGTH=116 /DNA_ID=CAMNT_0013261391 /DNA_START=792 /DNA_END=1142 /DNA_ORIENTATION=-
MTSQQETHRGTVEIQTMPKVVSAVINDDTTLLAISDNLKTMLYQLHTDTNADTITTIAMPLFDPLSKPQRTRLHAFSTLEAIPPQSDTPPRVFVHGGVPGVLVAISKAIIVTKKIH